MRQTSGGFDLLVLLQHHVSASLYSFVCTRSVREGVGILATLTLNYETKIRWNQKNLAILGCSEYLKSTKSAKGTQSITETLLGDSVTKT